MSLDYFITMKEGVASTTAIALNTDHTVVVGEGEINLKTERLNLSVKPVPKQGIGPRLTGKLNVRLSVFTRPFKLGGTLAHPSLAVDPTRTAIAFGRAVRYSYEGRSVMQADRQIQGSSVILKAGGRVRRRAEQAFCIV